MKQFKLCIFLCCLSLSALAQNDHPVSWRFSTEQTAPLTYRVSLHASVKEPYHIYPRQASGGMGLPTEIIFEENDTVVFADDIPDRGSDQQEGETLAS